MTRDELLLESKDANVRAFLYAIRACEGTSGPDGYRTLYGGELFGGYDDHPNIKVTAGGYTSTAAGAFQYLYSTWHRLRVKYGFPSFAPEWQDAGAVALLLEKGALDDARAGRVSDAARKCNGVWASLPGSPYGQPTKSMDFVIAAYQRAGGAVFSDTVATPATGGKPMGPFAIPALTILAQLIPSLAKLFKGENPSAVAERNMGAVQIIADKVLPMVIAATGSVNAEEAVTKIQTQPDARAAATQAVDAAYYELVEVGGGIKEARTFALQMLRPEENRWASYGFGFMLFLLAVSVVVGGGAVMSYLLIEKGTDDTVIAQVLDYFKAAGFIVLGYTFGSSASSRRSGETVQRIAEGK